MVAETFVKVDVTTLREEHLGLYNLLGDPATRLQYPERASVDLSTATGGVVRSGQALRVTVNSPAVPNGQLLVTLETTRRQIPDTLISPSDLKRMSRSDAFDAMVKNHEAAVNKVLTPKNVPLTAGRTILEIKAPIAPGRYYIKALVEGKEGVAAGHAEFAVISRP
jgi:hypothetical protein